MSELNPDNEICIDQTNNQAINIIDIQDDIMTVKKVLENQEEILKLKNKRNQLQKIEWLDIQKNLVNKQNEADIKVISGFRFSNIDSSEKTSTQLDIMFSDFIGCNNEDHEFTIYSTKFSTGFCGGVNKMERVFDVYSYISDDSEFTKKSSILRNVIMLLFQNYQKETGGTDIRKDSDCLDVSYNPKNLQYTWQKKCQVFISPKSGKGKAQHFYNEAEPAQKANGFQLTPIVTEYAGHANDYIRELSEEEYREYYQIIVCGGDGMVNEVINGFYKRKTPGMMDTNQHFRFGTLQGGSACAAMSYSCKRHGLSQGNINALYVITRQQFKTLRIMRNEIENENKSEVSITNENNKKVIPTIEQQNVLEKQPTKFIYAFHSLSVGLTVDCLKNTIKYRYCGESRYKVGSIFHILYSMCFTKTALRKMKIYTSTTVSKDNLPKLSEPITKDTPGDWKIWDEDYYLDFMATMYPYFTAVFTVTHRIKWDPPKTSKNPEENDSYIIDDTKGGPVLEIGGDSAISKGSSIKFFNTLEDGELYKYKDSEMQEWSAFRIEITDPKANFKNCQIMIDGDVYDGLKVQGCTDSECVKQTA